MSPKPVTRKPADGSPGPHPRERSDAPLSSFEAAFLELQRVVERLEDGSLELEQALELFERGNQLAQTCQRLLDSAELRVTRLSPETANPLSDA